MSVLIKPQGKICSIVPSRKPLDLSFLFDKSVAFSWELMFTRSQFKTEDMEEHHVILNKIAKLYEEGKWMPTMTKTLHNPLNGYMQLLYFLPCFCLTIPH